MDKTQYKLSCTLVGHGEDVRAIANFEDGTLVSASRDKTARVWKPNRESIEYVESNILHGHNNFVSSVCVLNPTEKYPSSLIVTGSNDKHICIYVLGESEPMRKILAHKDTVCNLRAGVDEGTFLSSSWDLSAKLWSLDDIDNAKLILHGHTLAVWCVADLPNKTIVTGSADKFVIVWTRDGKQLHKLDGHTDCVRDIAAIKDDEFLTCANDATIKHWDAISGTCLGTYYGHENYIYGISATINGTIVVTSGEDKTIRVWKNGEVDQTLTLPTSSVWCVTLLPNGDIAAGSSDGIVRVFSANPDRWASTEILKMWDQLIIDDQLKSEAESNKNIKINELPTVSELGRPGNRDGQTKMFNENGKAVVYSWSANDQQWIKIGDVIGEPGGNSSKQLYNGIEYDYVFSVDIQDGVPPLKLPYNKTDDPWVAAQKFIHDNELSQMFLDQVANFIIKNSTPAPNFAANSQFADPFTGGSRYIPGSGLPNARTTPTATSTVTTAADPFTGGNRYIPGASQMPSPTSSNISASYIPHGHYLKLEQANLTVILEKLKELNSKQTESTLKLSDEQLESVLQLVNTEKTENNPEIINNFWQLLNWPSECVFPVLDIARLAVLHKRVNDELCTDNLMPIIMRHLGADAISANQMLTFRLLANMFNHERGERLNLMHNDDVLNALIQLKTLGSKNNQVAISTYMLNLIVGLNKLNDAQVRTRALNVMMNILPSLKESEAVFRLLVALGTLLLTTYDTNERLELISTIKKSTVTINLINGYSNHLSMSDPLGKVSKCSKDIIDLIA
ncbi:hypothetical protein PV327_004650 [Microctonus hyperodae]|uniref:Phospholipase A-2-activating protein n=1 Tax=Microctonus hyperodae TaxID=165561 RepID=A0AA39FD47_MICHY|nr:hypothetical protein PV327_004650 [Microctonus hyperodae]